MTTPGGADDRIQRIKREYDDLSRVEKISSYHALSGGEPNSEVAYSYNSWGLVGTDWQEHDGPAVTTGGSQSLKVQYAYEDGADGGEATGTGQRPEGPIRC